MRLRKFYGAPAVAARAIRSFALRVGGAGGAFDGRANATGALAALKRIRGSRRTRMWRARQRNWKTA